MYAMKKGMIVEKDYYKTIKCTIIIHTYTMNKGAMLFNDCELYQ